MSISKPSVKQETTGHGLLVHGKFQHNFIYNQQKCYFNNFILFIFNTYKIYVLFYLKS